MSHDRVVVVVKFERLNDLEVRVVDLWVNGLVCSEGEEVVWATRILQGHGDPLELVLSDIKIYSHWNDKDVFRAGMFGSVHLDIQTRTVDMQISQVGLHLQKGMRIALVGRNAFRHPKLLLPHRQLLLRKAPG